MSQRSAIGHAYFRFTTTFTGHGHRTDSHDKTEENEYNVETHSDEESNMNGARYLIQKVECGLG